MNRYLPPPDTDESGDGFDAWYDVWIEEDGSIGSYLGFQDESSGAGAIKSALQRELEDLIGGRTRRLPNRRNPSGEVDLDLKVVMVRVVHQRNGETSTGWGPCGADAQLLRPLAELATVATKRLPGHPVGGGPD